MEADLKQRWDSFLVTFFGSGNRLNWPSDNEIVNNVVEKNVVGLVRTPPGPFILPLVDFDNVTRYFALAADDDEAQELRRLLEGAVGPTYTDFSGRTLSSDSMDQIEAAAIRFAGDPRRVYSFTVVGSESARATVRDKLLLLLQLSHVRPPRRVANSQPIGRLLRDFDRAIIDQDEETARRLLWGPILHMGRLSGMNNVFLQTRFLAGFNRWSELKMLPALDDVLRIRKPALVSDALAQLALYEISQLPPTEVAARVNVFETEVAPRFGALIPSVESIRSDAGAEYYVLWQLQGGADPENIRDRLNGLRYLDLQIVRNYLSEVGHVVAVPETVKASDVAEAVALGQFEYALELLDSMPPSTDTLPPLIQAARQTFSQLAWKLTEDYRAALGDSIVDEALASFQQVAVFLPESLSKEVQDSWASRVQRVMDGKRDATQLELEATEAGVLDLLRNPEQLNDLVDVLERANPSNASLAVRSVLILLNRLDEAAPLDRRSELGRLRRIAIDLWSLEDQTGDRSLAADVVDQVELLLDAGVSTNEYQDLVDELSLRWGPFLTDPSFGLSIRTLESLLRNRPGSDTSVTGFCVKILSRIGSSNIERLLPSDVLVGDSISVELGLGLSLREMLTVDSTPVISEAAPAVRSIGLYSLDEAATRRASEIFKNLLPDVEVRISHDKVSSQRLRSMAQDVDLMVVATRSAKHPATEAIDDARGDKDLVRAAGKGSSSLVQAVIDYLNR